MNDAEIAERRTSGRWTAEADLFTEADAAVLDTVEMVAWREDGLACAWYDGLFDYDEDEP